MTSERDLKDAMQESMRAEGFTPKKGSTGMSPPHHSDRNSGTIRSLPVAFDFRVPIVWMLGGAIFVGAGLIGMYYQLANLSEKVSDLQASVKVANTTTIQFASEQALIKYRVEKLEHENRADRR